MQSQATQRAVIGIQALERFAPGAVEFGLSELWDDRADNAGRDAILQVEDVFQRPVESICPQMGAGFAVDELSRNANLIARFADTALEHVADAKLMSDLLGVDCLALVGEARVPRDHEERLEARQG